MNGERDVSYPAWWHVRAAARREALAAAVDRIRHVVREDREIAGALVFGSYATGRVGPDSDLDVMLVMKNPLEGDAGARYARLVARLSLQIPCDLIVYDRSDFDRLVRERNFVAQARRQGLWIDAATSA